MAALVAFDFDIGLSTQTWIHWLQQLRLVASEVGEKGLCEAPTIYTDGLLLDAKVIEKGGSFKSQKDESVYRFRCFWLSTTFLPLKNIIVHSHR